MTAPTPNGYFDFAAGLANRRDAHVLSSEVQFGQHDTFPAAWRAMSDESIAQVDDCSRRAAKTTTSRLRTCMRSQQRPNWRTLYLHRTRALGKSQFFETEDPTDPGVVELLARNHVPVVNIDRVELSLRLANNSYVQAVGCDNIKEVNKKLGFKWNDIIIDECQDWNNDILTRLVEKTILPTLIDRGGSLTLMGTPADVESGLWYEAKTAYLRPPDPRCPVRWKRHHWTLLDNPYIDRKKIIDAMAIAGYVIDFDDPTNNAILIQREIFGLQVIDPSKLVYEYKSDRNDFTPGTLDFRGNGWLAAMGIDIGGAKIENDKDAIIILAWNELDPAQRIYEAEAYEGHGDIAEFCDTALEIYQRWPNIVSVCGDTGGAAASKTLVNLSKRMGGLTMAPKPTDVANSQRLVNDDFRSGRAKLAAGGIVAAGAKTCLKGKHEADIMASYRYAHHGAYHYLAEQPPAPTPDRDRHAAEWMKRLAIQKDPFNPYRRRNNERRY